MIVDLYHRQIYDENPRHFREGPLPGDLAELEAFCRIFRIAEEVHNVVMEALLFASQNRDMPRPQPNGSIDCTHLEDNEAHGVGAALLLEEKVVSSLGRIGALLHQQKEEVLAGRLGLGPSLPDSLPPLARFRADMQQCCEDLEVVLCCYFPIGDERFRSIHRKLQKLVNICFDAGHARADGAPSHADIPNWGAVSLHTPHGEGMPDQDIGLVLWRGGRLTEEGIHWLIEKGFKAIVDLRAEASEDQLTKSLLKEKVSSGLIRHFRLPVDHGSNPTKEQVSEFTRITADPENYPLYFHSHVGLDRTFLMISRWREFTSRSSFGKDALVIPEKGGQDNAAKFRDGAFLHGKGNHRNGSSDEEMSATPLNDISSERASSNQIVTSPSPFEAQRPAFDLFSKHGMSKFLKRSQISPANFQLNGKVREAVKLNAGERDEPIPLKETILEPAGRWGLDGPGIPRAGTKDDGLMSKHYLEKGASDTMVSRSLDTNGLQEGKLPEIGLSSSGLTKGALYRVSENESLGEDADDPLVVGNMCASTTGVVRLQSRKKAEMYLVRTDGFSCTREKVRESTLAFTHPSTQQQMLMWKTAPKTVFLLKKLGNELMQAAQEVASFLHYQEGMNVIVEPEVHDHFAGVPGFGFIQTFYSQDTSNLHERVDFVVCLGGDGVILHASNLFRNAVPPVVSFNLGSLGFLTAHLFKDFMQDLRAIIHGNSRVEGVYITLRMRLRCELFRNGKPVPGKIFEVLNEVVLDRGSNPYLCKIECFERNRLITRVQADGVIVATPTGSTAYSTSAGGSMVHPNVPCMLFTPICPHSLSFRPVILPDSALLELKVPENARSNVWVSFDGKKRQQLSRGDSVRICMSEHPLPTVNKSDQTDDWFRSLVRCLNWNERLEQKRL